MPSGTGISDLSSLMIHYQKGFVDAVNTQALANKVPLGKWKYEGSQARKHLRVGRNTGVTFSSDGGAYPTNTIEEFTTMDITQRFLAAQAIVTNGALAKAKTDKRAARSTAKSITKGLKESMVEMRDWFFFGDGTGKVATVQTGTTGTTLKVDDARALWRNQTYAVYDSTYATLRGYLTISKPAITGSSNVFTATTSATVPSGTTATDVLVWAPGSVSAYGKMWTGLDSLIGTGNLQGVNVTNHPEWQSVGISSSTSLTARLIRQLNASIAQFSGKEKVDNLIMSNAWTMLDYEELFQGDQRLTPRAKMAGITAPVFQSVFGTFMPMTAKLAPYSKVYSIARKELSRVELEPLSWVPGTKGIWHPSTEFMGYYAMMTEISEMAIEDRRCCGKITGLTSSENLYV